MREDSFAMEGQKSGVPDRIACKVKAEPRYTLFDVMTLVKEGYLRLEKESVDAKGRSVS